MAAKKLYGVSYKYEYGAWNYAVYRFGDESSAERWLHTEEYDFRTRELMTKTDAVKMAGRKAVDNAKTWQ